MKRENYYKEGLDTPLRALIKKNREDINKHTATIDRHSNSISEAEREIMDLEDGVTDLDNRVSALEEGGTGGGEVYPPVGQEVVVGKWVDGSDVYRKVIYYDNMQEVSITSPYKVNIPTSFPDVNTNWIFLMGKAIIITSVIGEGTTNSVCPLRVSIDGRNNQPAIYVAIHPCVSGFSIKFNYLIFDYVKKPLT